MPWRPRYTREEAAEAIARSSSWADALRFLGLSPRGKNFATIRKWAARWEIPVDHLPPYRPGRSAPRFSEAEARTAIAASNSWSEALRRLDYCPTGGNPATLRAWAARWGIPTDHFESPDAMLARIGRRRKMPIEEILVQGSTYNRSSLKARLYDEGLKQPVCELCGQDEIWRGRRMGLILDHISGVRDDNRLENLRIICPNCAATLDTHCGRKHPNNLAPRSCLRCGTEFRPKYRDHRYCSRECGCRWDRVAAAREGRGHFGVPNLKARKVERPPYEQLLAEIKRFGYLALGRKYGVTDNAIRKWIREYERQRALEAGRDPRVVEIPTRTWPNRRENRRAA
jgi:hypothetical protein